MSTWAKDAACIEYDPDWWFPHPKGGKGTAANAREAKAICEDCPVRTECLRDGLQPMMVGSERYSIPDGIWGGLNRAERLELRRRLTRARKNASRRARYVPGHRGKDDDLASRYQRAEPA